MIRVIAKSRGITEIGRCKENEHRVVVFTESAEILQMYPNASVTVLHQRSGDPDAYPVPGEYVNINDGMVEWTVRSSDLAIVGRGQCAVVFTSDGVVAKTMIYETQVREALATSDEPPEPWQSWVDSVTNAANRATEAAQTAEETVEGIGAAGEEQIQAIENKGKEVIESIPDDYTALDTKVNTLEQKVTNLITAAETGLVVNL